MSGGGRVWDGNALKTKYKRGKPQQSPELGGSTPVQHGPQQRDGRGDEARPQGIQHLRQQAQRGAGAVQQRLYGRRAPADNACTQWAGGRAEVGNRSFCVLGRMGRMLGWQKV
jgi:hypothetical protein